MKINAFAITFLFAAFLEITPLPAALSKFFTASFNIFSDALSFASIEIFNFLLILLAVPSIFYGFWGQLTININ